MIKYSANVMTTTPIVKDTLSNILTCGVSFMWSRILLLASPVIVLRHCF